MKQVNVEYAQAHFSVVLASVERGQEVVIMRGEQPVARLVPFEDQADRVLGFVPYSIPEAFFEQLPDEEVVVWEDSV